MGVLDLRSLNEISCSSSSSSSSSYRSITLYAFEAKKGSLLLLPLFSSFCKQLVPFFFEDNRGVRASSSSGERQRERKDHSVIMMSNICLAYV